MENLSKLIESIAKLIDVIVWPGIFLWITLRYREEIGSFLHDVSEGSLEAFGMKASAKKINAVNAIVTAQLSREEEKLAPNNESTPSIAERVSTSLTAADSLVSTEVFRKFGGKRLLWVDDHAINNILERKAFEALGLNVDTAPNTTAAITKIRIRGQYDLIISDMYRDGDQHAGYNFIQLLRNSGVKTRVIIYCGSSSPEEQKEAESKGAFGRASEPTELLSLVRLALDY